MTTLGAPPSKLVERGLLELLARSIESLSKEQDPGWKRLRLRQWAEGRDFPLASLETLWILPAKLADRTAYRVASNGEALLLAVALRQAAQAIKDTGVDCDKAVAQALAANKLATLSQVALGLADRDTENSGVYTLLHLDALVSAKIAPGSGLLVRLDQFPLVHLDFNYRGKPITPASLAALALP